MQYHRRALLVDLSKALIGLPVLLAATPSFAAGGLRDLAVEVIGPNVPIGPSGAKPALMTASLATVGSSVLKIGERLLLRVATNRGGFGHLYVCNTSGAVTLLAENLPLKANQPIDLPAGDLVLRAAPPAGDNTVLFVATRVRLGGVSGGETNLAPADIQLSPDGLMEKLKAELKSVPRNRWASALLTLRVTS